MNQTYPMLDTQPWISQKDIVQPEYYADCTKLRNAVQNALLADLAIRELNQLIMTYNICMSHIISSNIIYPSIFI